MCKSAARPVGGCCLLQSIHVTGGLSGYWSNSMIIAQVRLNLATIKWQKPAAGMLTAEKSTRAVTRELNAHFPTISRLQGVSEKLAEHLSLKTTDHMQHPYHQLLRQPKSSFRFEWTDAHIQWRLAPWRGVLYTDEFHFSMCRADGGQRVQNM